MAETLTGPVGIVRGDCGATHVGSAAVNVTEMPGEGAAVAAPLLWNSIVMLVPKTESSLAEADVMFSENPFDAKWLASKRK